jgi:hypothetical protein
MPDTQKSFFSFNWVLKLFGAAALLLVLGIGFLGYLTPGMRINWETIATMCGF